MIISRISPGFVRAFTSATFHARLSGKRVIIQTKQSWLIQNPYVRTLIQKGDRMAASQQDLEIDIDSALTSEKQETCYDTEKKQEGKRPAEDTKDSGNKRLKFEQECDSQAASVERVKRKKFAMFLIYSGSGYVGMQRNPGQNTIEEELLKALLAEGLITPEMWKTTSKMEFQRAARTDKGVSAAGQVVSLKLPLDASDHIVQLNSLLPKDIRVIDIKKATKGFNSKNNCMSRTYAYITPTFAFSNIEEMVTEKYRISEETISRVNKLLALYKGTHKFHNFTSGKKPDDASATRYILHFECGEPFILDGIEFCVLKVKGQSFMLHQIRKMIGLVIAIVKGFASEKTVEMAWGPEKVDIPKAPGLGLILERLHYDVYNKRFGDDGIHEKLEWSEYEGEIEKFKQEYIYSNIVTKEKEENSMINWMSTLPLHTYDTYRDEDRERESTLYLKAKTNLVNHWKESKDGEICKKASCESGDKNISSEEAMPESSISREKDIDQTQEDSVIKTDVDIKQDIDIKGGNAANTVTKSDIENIGIKTDRSNTEGEAR